MFGSTAGVALVKDTDTTASVEAAIAAIAAGRPVVVTDHPERENEGDLVIAAEDATAAVIAFMMTECRGLICVPVTAARAQTLELPPMVVRNSEALRTAFTVSVDAARGVTTGISATDRAVAVGVLADPASGPADLVRPGHLFPLIAAPGGVLERAGHTEAAIDLAVLAGRRPAGVICEIAGEDGEMLRGESLRAFSRAHGLVQISIAELVRYRQAGVTA
ncbi:3,4-dihydroxy-2-butanone-4-phosphate synthase [Demequina sp.]|uniref:3,4-dihydroxy-2-butanone-4-phosphate synthase n=1 Tax=Demequina sp. TaxID=2050685 RepID=UPI0025BBBE3B|nr:3,4-dihydroxy-2-butanone-4-phosphate synthase [Demequina sp.]